MNMYHQAKYFHLRKIFFNATAKSNAEKRIDRLHEYTPTSKIYSQAERENIEVPADLDKTSLLNYSNQAAASYALSHGTPKEVLPEVVAKVLIFYVKIIIDKFKQNIFAIW